eukprot:6170441-Pyramimonas_sp.AAC.1
MGIRVDVMGIRVDVMGAHHSSKSVSAAKCPPAGIATHLTRMVRLNSTATMCSPTSGAPVVLASWRSAAATWPADSGPAGDHTRSP